jgi:hypothetical protein
VFVTVESLSLEELCCLTCSCFLCFCVEICLSETKSLVGHLIACSLSAEILPVFREDNLVTGVKCYFSSLDLGVGVVAQ